jgi:Bax protein
MARRKRNIILLVIVGLIIIVLLYLIRIPSFNTSQIDIQEITISKSDSINISNDSLINPICYKGVPEFDKLTPGKRKEKFIQFMLPAILVVRHQLIDNLKHIRFIENRISLGKKLNPTDTLFLQEQCINYKCNTIEELKMRIYPHPTSIALAQAAIESGWGTSRFFKEGYNIFGVWSYSKNDLRIKSEFNRGDKEIYVKAYNDYIESVHNYFRTIGRVNAYRNFREKRLVSNNTEELIDFLNSYSEEDAYTDLISSIVRNNKLSIYDNYSLNKRYIKSNYFRTICNDFLF